LDYVTDTGLTQTFAPQTAGGPSIKIDSGAAVNVCRDGQNWLVDELRISNTTLTTDQFLRAVPEPATITILGVGLLTVLRRRHN
jgi:hypothetical protein